MCNVFLRVLLLLNFMCIFFSLSFLKNIKCKTTHYNSAEINCFNGIRSKEHVIKVQAL